MQPDQAGVEFFIVSWLTAHLLVFRYRLSLSTQEISAVVVGVNVTVIRSRLYKSGVFLLLPL